MKSLSSSSSAKLLLLILGLLPLLFSLSATGSSGDSSDDPEAEKKRADRVKTKEILAKANEAMRNELEKLAKEQAKDEKLQSQLKQLDAAKKQHPDEEKGGGRAPKIQELNAAHLDELYEMDILLTSDQAKRIFEERDKPTNSSSSSSSSSTRKRRGAAMNPSYWTTSKWPNAVVPYIFDAAFPTTLQPLVQKAMKMWSDNSCLVFQLNANAPNKLRFTAQNNGCWARLGRVASLASQEVNLGPGCEYIGLAAHEIGHALGFFHEQSRWDRDDWVIYNAANVNPSFAYNFQKETPTTNENYGHQYDLGSVMHYADVDFSTNGQPVLLAKLGAHLQRTMGQRMGPSHYDYKVMNSFYCQGRCPSTIVCYNGGFQNPNNCAVCICPSGTTNADCGAILTNDGVGAWSSNGYAPPNVPNTCTGKLIHALDTAQELTGQIGTTNHALQDQNDYAWCHWYIYAAEGRRLAIEVLEVGNVCERGCWFGHTEIRIREGGEWGKTGIRLCCPSDLGTTGTLTLTTTGNGYYQAGVPANHAMISLYASYDVQRFKIRFWQY